MWPFGSSKSKENEESDEESVYTEEEYEEEYEYEVEVTDDEYETSEDEEVSEYDDENIDDESDSEIKSESNLKEHGEEEGNEVSNVGKDESLHDVEVEDEDSQEENQAREEVPGAEYESQQLSKSYSENEDSDSHHDLENDSGDETTDDGNEVVDSEEEEDNAVTSDEEKHSLLALAAEHDRVDILQSILSSAQPEERAMLIDPPQQNGEEEEAMPPPLHIAISFGSTNATTCLLRMGANPSIRPFHKKFHGRTAWELAFGSNAEETNDENKKSWFSPNRRASSCSPVDMAPSKREGILHAFTAEALRCIGADDKERLSQLLESGMPKTMDMGGDKNIVDWCKEMGAENCLNMIEPREQKVDPPSPDGENEMKPAEKQGHVPLVRRLSSEVDEQEMIENRLEEFDTLAAGLSTYLDNLAEEVSVCHGLLLMGNGASALASHVRSLKEQQDFLRNDLQDRNAEWARAEEELSHSMHQYNKTEEDLELKHIDFDASNGDISSRRARRIASNDPIQLKAQVCACENKIRKLRASIADMSEESETAMKEVERRGLTGGIKLVRKYREEIRQLEFQVSEAKSGEAVFRAKLQLLQELVAADTPKEYKEIAQISSSESNGNSHIQSRQLVQPEQRKNHETDDVASSGRTEEPVENGSGNIIKVKTTLHPGAAPASLNDDKADDGTEEPPEDHGSKNRSLGSQSTNAELSHSEKVTTGQSNALIKYQETSGYMSVDLWQVLLRIIGLGRVAVRQNVENLKQQSSTVMIV